MDKEQLDQRHFFVAKYLAHYLHMELKLAGFDYYVQNMDRDFVKARLSDERALLRILKKRVEEHNSRISATLTRLKNMRYQRKWRTSELFKGINIDFSDIERRVKEHPEADPFDIYMKIRNRII